MLRYVGTARLNAQAALPSVALWSEDKIAIQIAEFENNKIIRFLSNKKNKKKFIHRHNNNNKSSFNPKFLNFLKSTVERSHVYKGKVVN